MSSNPYAGIYSSIGAGTTIGTEVYEEVGPGVGNNLIVSDSSNKGRQYQSISKSTLEDADLNVAKIRLVSTLPGKEIPKELRGKAYVGFILTGVQESHSEKLEVVNLPGDTFASYFYGASPRQFSFSGILVNTDQDQWRDAFEELYEKYLRGSVSSRNFSIVQISYNGRVVSGWLTNLSQQLNSDNDHYASFTFSVLVSRIDMVGGSKKFSDYLVTLSDDGGDFAGANIDTDYAVLDPTNFNGMIDPIRTGMVIPPKRPHKVRGKKKVTQNCWFPAEKTDSGKATNTGAVTANNHINDASKCSIIEAIEGTNAKIQEALKNARELLDTKDGRVPTQADIEKAKAEEARAADLRNRVRENMAKHEVIEQFDRETDQVVEYYRAVAAGTQKATEAERKRAQAALEAGKIPVGKATIEIFDIGEEGKPSEIIVTSFESTGDSKDPPIYDGTELTEHVAQKQAQEFYPDRGKDKDGNVVNQGVPEGLGERAQRLRKKKDDDDKKKRQEAAAKATARRLAKRSKS